MVRWSLAVVVLIVVSACGDNSAGADGDDEGEETGSSPAECTELNIEDPLTLAEFETDLLTAVARPAQLAASDEGYVAVFAEYGTNGANLSAVRVDATVSTAGDVKSLVELEAVPAFALSGGADGGVSLVYADVIDGTGTLFAGELDGEGTLVSGPTTLVDEFDVVGGGSNVAVTRAGDIVLAAVATSEGIVTVAAPAGEPPGASPQTLDAGVDPALVTTQDGQHFLAAGGSDLWLAELDENGAVLDGPWPVAEKDDASMPSLVERDGSLAIVWEQVDEVWFGEFDPGTGNVVRRFRASDEDIVQARNPVITAVAGRLVTSWPRHELEGQGLRRRVVLGEVLDEQAMGGAIDTIGEASYVASRGSTGALLFFEANTEQGACPCRLEIARLCGI